MRRSEDKKRYGDACAAAHGMDLIGERWSMPLIRELLLGPRRFSDLRASLRGISANVLTQRLEGLENAGILRRTRLPPPASVQAYELTEWGAETAPIFQALGRWAVRSPQHDPGKPFSPVSLMLSLRTMVDECAAGDFAARANLRIGEEDFFWVRAKGEVRIGRGLLPDADFSLGAPDASAIAGVVYGGQPLDSIVAEGKPKRIRRFLALFPLPPKAS